MYSFILISTLITISGLIAFVGDWMGIRVGKKRITIFGLRPHYTAIFITIIAGILIAAITITILAISSNDVRTALFGIAELKGKLSYLSREVDTRNLQLTSMQKNLDEKTNILIKIQEEMVKLQKELSLATGEHSIAMRLYVNALKRENQ